MAEIPESLLRRSAEAKAKALGLPVEQVLAEMKGEAPPTPPPAAEPAPPPPAAEVAAPEEAPVEAPETPAAEPQASSEASEVPTQAEQRELVAAGLAPSLPEAPPERPAPETPPPPERAPGNGNGSGNGRRAAVVATRPVVPPTGIPEGVRTQRLLTVVKARAIQQVKPEPTDKVNTWPHLMLAEFSALLAVTGVLVILSIILQAPLLDPANLNATPNPSKAPWYFLGLQELLSYFDPQIAGVTVPTIVGLIGFMAIPFVDRNPSTKPSDRKFAIMLYTFFMAGSATLTIFGVLFRGLGFNFAYPWNDGVFFDDIKDWVHFE